MAASNQAGIAVPVVSLSSGKPMPRLGLGTASFPLGEDGDRRPHVREAILRAIDAGYRHFDTAAVYGTERALGDAAADAVRAGTIASRDELYVTSKLWVADAHPGRVLPALRKTLRNLQMEYVDLYLIHFPVSMKMTEPERWSMLVKENLVAMDMKGVWEEMEECHRKGLAKAIGISNFTCKKLEYLLSFVQIIPAVNQVEVQPYCRQNKLRAFCREKGIQLCAYSPLGGKGTPWGNNSVLDSPILKQIAEDMGKTVAQVCIRWVYEQGDSIIPKSFSEKRMRENLDIFNWELTDDARHKIGSLPEFRGNYDFFVHDSGPYKTAEEFWDDTGLVKKRITKNFRYLVVGCEKGRRGVKETTNGSGWMKRSFRYFVSMSVAFHTSISVCKNYITNMSEYVTVHT